MQVPRLTKSIFLDQFIFMQLIGFVIGLLAPFFWLWNGIPAEYVMTWHFFITAQLAGQTVGLVSFLLISTVVRPHLKLLALKMKDIADALDKKALLGSEGRKCDERLCQIETVSKDEIGVSAQAYNQMLHALIQSHEIERVYTSLSKVMSENLELSTLSDEVLALLIASTHIDAAAILIRQNGVLTLAATNGIKDAESLGTHTLLTKVAKTGVAHKITLPKEIYLEGVLAHFNPSEVFIEPIEFKEEILGVLVTATGKSGADERTEQLIKLFSRSVGLAINNALTHEKFQELAAVDGLTNIYNRRFGMERLKEDYARAVRDQTTLTVVMVDIDHFKKVNDTYGHLVGDRAIVLTTSILKNSLRDGDIVIRYGGEEFLMILHGATADNAVKVCERIRSDIQNAVLKEQSEPIQLTVSMGVATYPDQATQNEVELINLADQALYHAKKTGRNKVVHYHKMADKG
ncbi:MAG: sensor domain-containing diguanylate cyclase [Gammaproteobacteria bacterium]|nr:sensor domain-containing diguanylate cyclase [Gammaproteobacteria bacterium]